MQTVLQNNRGLTVVEVLISSLVTLVLFLAVMQTTLLSIDSNTSNVLRDEAVRIAEERMRDLRSIPFDEYESKGLYYTGEDDSFITDYNHTDGGQPQRKIRNKDDYKFTRNISIVDVTPTTKKIGVQVQWEWKDRTFANNNPYVYTIFSIKRQ